MYPDIAPVMLLSEASVKDLSSKMEKAVTVERFRPSIVISDCEPFDEVRWVYAAAVLSKTVRRLVAAF